jgi:hypothetical protein
MGRYARFNTGFEYTFVFGVQPSGDMLEFGGSPKGYKGELFHHEWDVDDLVNVERNLLLLEVVMDFNRPAIEKFEKNINGTETLLEEAWKTCESGNGLDANHLVARYILGLVIYHQLLCTDKLSVEYQG